MRRICCRLALSLFVLCISACVSTSTTTHPASPDGVAAQPPYEEGAAVARHLQERYDQTFVNCDRDPQKPAFYCSGILLRSTEFSPSYRSWRPNPATAPYGVSYSWLRTDANFDDVYPTGNGFIVYPEKFALSHGLTPMYVRCMYPRDAWSAAPDRCTWREHPPATPVYGDTCQKLGIDTAAKWMAAGYNDDTNQCAFDVGTSASDRASVVMALIDIRQQKRMRWRNELIVRDWTSVPDDHLPLEAFFYRANWSDPGKPDPLASAQEDQKDYQRTVGRWLPVIRAELTAQVSGGAKFIYREADQAILPGGDDSVGEDTARHLQSRFDESNDYQLCPERPSIPLYSCSGVMFRPGWDGDVLQPQPGDEITGIEVNWVRSDVNATSLRRNVGLVFFPSKYIKPPQRDVISVACAFPDRKDTSSSVAWRCGIECQDLANPIIWSQDWISRGYRGGDDQCAFSMTTSLGAAFDWRQVLGVRKVKKFLRAGDVIVRPWHASDVEVPVEAIYFVNGDTGARDAAHIIQTWYRSVTHRWMPIIRVGLPSSLAERMTFSYQRSDQKELP